MEISNGVLRSGSRYKCNFKNRSDGLELLRDICNESVKICFFDPQYRGVLDKLSCGNEGKGRGESRSSLQQMSEAVIVDFIREIERVLVPSGYLFLWVDDLKPSQLKENVLAGIGLEVVDLITWDKGKKVKGVLTPRRSEHLLVIQKAPFNFQETLLRQSIPDVWSEIVVDKNHPHTKPVGLQAALIAATTKENDFVLDPAAGGYSVLRACELMKRNFIGGDIEA